jgi:hypothetical protein
MNTRMTREELQYAGRRGGSSPKRPFRFSIHDIVAAKHRSLASVRKDRQKGLFDPYNLASLVAYLST